MRTTILFAGLLISPAILSTKEPLDIAGVERDDPRLQVLWQYFDDRDCPLRDSVADFLVAADQNELDWRLLPSISMIESSGGKDYRNNNVFGWDSCRGSFPSVQAGIHYVATRLANSKLYKDKDLDHKLLTYNPQPDYRQRVKAVMRALGPAHQLRRSID